MYRLREKRLPWVVHQERLPWDVDQDWVTGGGLHKG